LLIFGEARHPQEVAQQQAIDKIARLQRFDDALARPGQRGIEPQRLTEGVECRFDLIAVEQRPAVIGVGERVLRRAGQRCRQRRLGVHLAAHPYQSHRLQVETGDVFRIALQASLRCRERALPITFADVDAADDGVVRRRVRVKAQRLADGAQGVGGAVLVQQDQRADVVGVVGVGGQTDGSTALAQRFLVAILVVEGQRQERVGVRVVRRGGERLAQCGFRVLVAPGLQEKLGLGKVFVHLTFPNLTGIGRPVRF